MTDEFEVVVLRRGVHGVPVSEYVAALEERLPDCTIRRAHTPEEERELVESARFVTGLDLEPATLEGARDLEVFACAYAGTGHLPMDRLAERGVAVTNASGVHGPNIGEHVLGATLAFVRRFHVGERRQRRREWRHYRTHELQGSTVTVVGLGALGTAICARLEPFGVESIGVRHSPEKGGPVDEVYGYDDDLHAAFARTDYLVLACPLTDETRGLIDEAALDTLPPTAVLVNVARGPVVDTDALLAALRGNNLRGAALDVTDPEPLPEDHPLWGLENVRITPHNAGFTPAYYERLADVVATNVERVRETGEATDLENQVV
ncbi:D-2-hydroxyacid dehydrogenase [Natrononativus amylolyticus]|uniref:D-2-hydroxyacid dehydrogenase n=1 Tax=Natrononativus amylolyticus TaxID=2963434 RepID=UPI0020CE58B3|nr:D-2-hydroxyacid dehydrogenase [Natrononativus amylolyticus]